MSEAEFPRALPGAFAWPLRHPVRLGVILGVGFALGALRAFPWPGLYTQAAFAFLGGCAVSWLFGVVRRATHPEDLRPETFERELDASDAWSKLLQFLAAAAAAYLPLAGFAAYALVRDERLWADPDFRVALGAVAVSGTLYFPMALLLLGYAGHWSAPFNLALGVRSMARLGADYALCAALFLVGAAAAAALELGWVRLSPPFSGEGWLARTSTSVAELYLTAVAMRALGLLYVAKGERLGWVARERT